MKMKTEYKKNFLYILKSSPTWKFVALSTYTKSPEEHEKIT